ncbi:MAG: hypothetical protein WCD79_09770 [Chthoniobacteraceae bacterium]
MERFELLTVEDTYAIKSDMLILRPEFFVPDGGWEARTENVKVLRPDRLEFEATAEIRMGHLNISDPQVPLKKRWTVTVWLTDRTAEEVPIGSKIFVSKEVRDSLIVAGRYEL